MSRISCTSPLVFGYKLDCVKNVVKLCFAWNLEFFNLISARFYFSLLILKSSLYLKLIWVEFGTRLQCLLLPDFAVAFALVHLVPATFNLTMQEKRFMLWDVRNYSKQRSWKWKVHEFCQQLKRNPSVLVTHSRLSLSDWLAKIQLDTSTVRVQKHFRH